MPLLRHCLTLVTLVLVVLMMMMTMTSMVTASPSTEHLAADATSSPESHRPFVVFVCFHDRGHWSVMQQLVEHAARLDMYEIGFAVARERRQAAEQLRDLGVSWIDAGSIPFSLDEETALKVAVFDPSTPPLEGLDKIDQFFGRIGEAMVKQLKPTFERRKPDFLVCDMMTTACTDLAEYFSIPSMMLAPFPSCFVDAVGWSISLPSSMPLLTIPVTQAVNMSFFDRVVAFVARPLLNLPSRFLLLKYRNNEVRHKLLNLPPVPSWHASGVQYPKPVVVVGSSLAWEPAASYPPFLHFVGPLLPKSAASKIDDDLRAWLEQPRETHGHVVYVATGTNVELDQAQVDALARAIGRVADAGHRVLWSLRSAQQAILFHQSNANNDNEQVTSRASWRERVRVMEWVPQLEVLSHENTRVFLSHCGHNSLMEALMHGRAILAMPFGADQPANARLVEHHGVGLATSPRPISSDDVAQSLLRLLDDEQFTINARRLQKKLALEPGFNEAIRLLRVGVEAGNEHFTPAIFKEHWIHHNDVDLMVLSAVAVIVVYQVVSWCCGCLLCRGSKKSSTTSATKKHHKAE